MICYFPLLLSVIGIMSEPVSDIEHFYRVTGRLRWQLEVKIRAFENLHKLTTVISGSATLAMAGTIVAEFIAANSGIGYSIRIALYQSDLSKILVALFIIGITLSLYQGILELLGSGVKKAWAAG
jgi:NitT/TauT family transport system permease protein